MVRARARQMQQSMGCMMRRQTPGNVPPGSTEGSCGLTTVALAVRAAKALRQQAWSTAPEDDAIRPSRHRRRLRGLLLPHGRLQFRLSRYRWTRRSVAFAVPHRHRRRPLVESQKLAVPYEKRLRSFQPGTSRCYCERGRSPPRLEPPGVASLLHCPFENLAFAAEAVESPIAYFVPPPSDVLGTPESVPYACGLQDDDDE